MLEECCTDRSGHQEFRSFGHRVVCFHASCKWRSALQQAFMASLHCQTLVYSSHVQQTAVAIPHTDEHELSYVAVHSARKQAEPVASLPLRGGG